MVFLWVYIFITLNYLQGPASQLGSKPGSLAEHAEEMAQTGHLLDPKDGDLMVI